MLQPVEIMSGFKNIRFVFRTKCKIRTTLSELALWFSEENEVLYVHNLENHDKAMALAFKDTKVAGGWKIREIFNSAGEALLKEAIDEDNLQPNKYLNYVYRLTDFVPFNRLK
jgi:hypothetical protein